MRKLFTLSMIMVALVAFMAIGLMADDAANAEKKAEMKEAAPAHEYVSAKKCKACHKDVYTSWKTTPHAKAFEALSVEEQKKPECVKCHMTGMMADGTAINNVECEACHGPGADYKKASIMSKKKWAADPEGQLAMAKEAGLIIPTEETCVRCHKKEGNPNFKEFDFEKMKGKVHAMPSQGE
jgi:mono/diheme cytochrome c family protein